MAKLTGVISKTARTANGFHRFLVDGTWYGTFKTDYSALEGRTVEFEASQRGDFWNADKVKEVQGAAAAPAVQRSDDRQASIVLQSSYKTAGEVLCGLLAAGVLPLPAKKNEQYGAALGFLDEIALRLYNNCIDASAFVAYYGNTGEDDTGGGAEYNPVEA